LSTVNLIDPESVDTWLDGIALKKAGTNGSATSRLLKIALKRHLLTHEDSAEVLTTPPENTPAWARDKWDACGPFHRFAPENDATLEGKVEHIADWLIAAQKNDAAFLKDLQGGKPKTLLHLKSIADAGVEADKYSASLRQQFLKTTDVNPDDGCVEIMKLANGMRIVELATKDALNLEGARMKNCVGDGAYDENVLNYGSVVVYSLRDGNNKPQATIETLVVDGSVRQCRGRDNHLPSKKAMPCIEEFARRFKMPVDEKVCETGLVQDVKGQVYSMYNLPENLHVKNLRLKGTPLETLPDGLTVDGDLDLTGSKIKTLPPGLKVKGTVTLNDLITETPEGLRCRRPRKSGTGQPNAAPPAP
jgi:hypothetical protein